MTLIEHTIATGRRPDRTEPALLRAVSTFVAERLPDLDVLARATAVAAVDEVLRSPAGAAERLVHEALGGTLTVVRIAPGTSLDAALSATCADLVVSEGLRVRAAVDGRAAEIRVPKGTAMGSRGVAVRHYSNPTDVDQFVLRLCTCA